MAEETPGKPPILKWILRIVGIAVFFACSVGGRAEDRPVSNTPNVPVVDPNSKAAATKKEAVQKLVSELLEVVDEVKNGPIGEAVDERSEVMSFILDWQARVAHANHKSMVWRDLMAENRPANTQQVYWDSVLSYCDDLKTARIPGKPVLMFEHTYAGRVDKGPDQVYKLFEQIMPKHAAMLRRLIEESR